MMNQAFDGRSWGYRGLSGGLVILLFHGCIAVDPRPDYRRAAGEISRMTGQAEAYDPQTEKEVGNKVQTLLADGLTVPEAVEVALLNNRELQAMFYELGVARADVVQAGLLTNPSFSLVPQFPEGGGRTKLTLSFGQEIVDLWQIPIRRKIAEAQLEQTVLRVAARAVELVAEVKTRAYRLLALQRAEVLAAEDVRLVDQSFRLAQARLEAGEASQLDVNLVKASLLDAQLRQIEVTREQRLAEVALVEALGLGRTEDSWSLRDELPANLPEVPEQRGYIIAALTQRLDVRTAELRVQAAEDEVRQEYMKVWPSVIVGVEWERPDRRALPGRKILADAVRESVANGQPTVPSIQSRAQRDAERRQIVDSLLGPSLALTLPIWDQNQAQIAKARFRAEQQRKEYERLLEAVARQMQEAVAVVQAAREQSRFVEEQALPLAERNLEATRQSYEAGEVSVLVLIEAQKFLIVQRRAHLDARLNCSIGLAELERAAGGRLPKPPASAPAVEKTR